MFKCFTLAGLLVACGPAIAQNAVPTPRVYETSPGLCEKQLAATCTRPCQQWAKGQDDYQKAYDACRAKCEEPDACVADEEFRHRGIKIQAQ